MKIVLIILLAVGIVATKETDYCTVECKGNSHIACKHSKAFSANCPSLKKIIDLGPAEQTLFKKLHNEKRNKIASGKLEWFNPACRMATMQWDDELAYLARLNVMQCEMRHDECHNTDKFLYTGQNIGRVTYMGMEFNADNFISETVDGWFNEYKYCSQGIIDEYPNFYKGPQVGHFTEMVIERNTHFGCAAALYGEDKKSWMTFLLVCNYASVNMVGFPIYESCINPAEKCKNTNPEFPNLCSISEKYDINVWMKNGNRYY